MLILAWILTAGAASQAAPTPGVHADHSHPLGSVSLPTSCNAAANVEVQRGLALLHHMMYDDAERAFTEGSRVQPGCGIAYWGRAMTRVHPLWSDPPDEQRFAQGKLLVETALRQEIMTAQERAYAEALQSYFARGRSAKEAANLRAFEEGWARVHERYPDDPDAALFYALAQLATADPADKIYAKQKRAGELAERIFASHRDHPGAYHYIIHAYDYPTLAPNALEVARAYGKIAPDVPHALHMPSHIFTRLGLWEESIDWNGRSAAAALRQPVDGAVSIHYLHALDYLVYAHLQRVEDDKAFEIRTALRRLTPPVQVELASAYAFAAVPARIALERRDWKAAAALVPREPAWYPWDRFPAVEAISQFSRALGAAHIGEFPLADTCLERLAVLRDQAAQTSEYWGTQVEIQRLSALAWLEFARGARDQALETMRSAAALEANTGKHPVTPGEVLPARELLADMLFELHDYAAAAREYARVLERSPQRYNSVEGAALAAARSIEVAEAR